MSLQRIITRCKPFDVLRSNVFTVRINQFSTKLLDEITTDIKKPKKPAIQKITLVSSENVSVTTLEEAQKISKRRDLKLVKVMDLDTKTQRPIYKLMTGSEYHAEDLKQREEKKKEKLNSNAPKGEKVLILSQGIAEHDLNVQINKIIKWVNKKYEIRAVINGVNNMDKAEKVFSYIESNLKDSGRILQKRQKGSDIKFQIIPPKKDKDDGDKNL